MKNSEQAARKKNKAADPNCGQVVAIKSTKERRSSDSAKKVKLNKKRCLVKGRGSGLLDPKKKKKQSDSESKKKACANPPTIIESSSDPELLRGIRKRLKAFKKKKDRKLSCQPVQDEEAVGEEQPDFHVRKKRGRNILEVEEQDEELTMKRKKEKEKRKHEPPCSLIFHGGDREESPKQILGKQKASCREMLLPGQKKRRSEGQKAVGDSILVKKKRLDYHKGNEETSNGISKEGTASSLCKLRDAQSCDGHMQRRKDLACGSENGSKAIKEKKKKKKLKMGNTASLSCLAKNQKKCGGARSKYCLKCKKGLRVGEAPKEGNKPAKKTKREAGDVSHFSEDGQDILSKVKAPGGKEKRRKAKKAEGEQDRLVRNGRDRFEDSQEQRIKKKRKNRETGSPQDSDWEASWKKAEAKQEHKEAEDEIKLVAFKKGNCDEVSIDKVRRQALQEEIDRESGKTKTVQGEPDLCFGQWSTATFETPEQKATFIRLLGGFKKGKASTQSPPANTTKQNFALDRSSEQKLQHNLQAEFEKAVAFKHHQGIGLGFQPVTPSRLHIDKYASKSIRFED